MKRFFLLGGVATMLLTGCKRENSTPMPVGLVITAQDKAQAITSRQVDIVAIEVPQSLVKDVLLEFLATPSSEKAMTQLPYRFEYDSQNRLSHIASGINEFWNLKATDDRATLSYDGTIKEYKLNSNGFGDQATVSKEGKSSEINYLYKNGYWIAAHSTEGDLISRVFSPEGNLLKWEVMNHDGFGNYTATYGYTNIPNTIRQEVNRWEAPHF
ncbi:hypothetical protein [Arundinibacter roseus]|uniref:Uncharacterized protein n=1 Tax=Arundinibacter roseus TaxID=2070510 RepID=A0A4R4KH77_9BACT|nr:hypothetical protein [Arundinibacter roseus]TDB67424.1 hypothetical protein EZE20_05620 [Arundinibacter roseus]